MLQCTPCELVFGEDWVCKGLKWFEGGQGCCVQAACAAQLSCTKHCSAGLSGFPSGTGTCLQAPCTCWLVDGALL